MAATIKPKRTRRRQQRRWTPEEIRRLPTAKRDAILAAAAAKAEVEYRTNRELTAFEAFGKGDLYGNSASSRPK